MTVHSISTQYNTEQLWWSLLSCRFGR